MTSSEGLPANLSSRSVTLLVKRILKIISSYSNEQTVQLSMTSANALSAAQIVNRNQNIYGYSFSISLSGNSDCGPHQLKGYFALVKVREGDTWKVRMATYSLAPAPPATPTRTIAP
jgi:hypothetical protein